jgi:hypothetical protein
VRSARARTGAGAMPALKQSKALGLKLEDFLTLSALPRLLGSEELSRGDRFALLIYSTLLLLVLFMVYASYNSPRRIRRRMKEEQKVWHSCQRAGPVPERGGPN